MKPLKTLLNRLGRLAARPAPALAILTLLSAFCLAQYGLPGTRTAGPSRAPNTIVTLPKPRLEGEISLEEALANQPGLWQFAPRPLGLQEIGQLAWAGQGIIDQASGLRTVPSISGLYPIKLYFATPQGLFVYNPQQHSLEQTLTADVRFRIAAAAARQPALAQAPCDIIIAGSIRQLTMQHGRQARKYMLLEAGHIAQNIQLQAVSLGLRSLTTAIFEAREVERTCRIPKEFEPTYILSVGRPLEQDQSEQGPLAGPGGVVFIVPNALFRDEELFETRFVLDRAGLNTIVAGARTGPVTGMLGNVVQAELTINELAVDNYDAIVFVGGPGARQYLKSSTALDIAREAAVKGKIIAAISTAPAILANAGVLQGIRATCLLTERGRLQQGGAIYTGTPVEVDGPVITARDPAAAALFGQAIADVLFRLP